jgi:hypothetical protein
MKIPHMNVRSMLLNIAHGMLPQLQNNVLRKIF